MIDSVQAAPNETVHLLSPDNHDLRSRIEVTFWTDGTLSLSVYSAERKIRMNNIATRGREFEITLEAEYP